MSNKVMADAHHWEQVYKTKACDTVSWYQETPLLSLKLISEFSHDITAHIMDVGCGLSSMSDSLITKGYQHLTLLDLSNTALCKQKQRHKLLTQQNDFTELKLQYINQSVTDFECDEKVDVWHDRAVFHFLTTKQQRQDYVSQLHKTANVNSIVIIAVFAPDGPVKCSGLSTVQYDEKTLLAELGEGFKLLKTINESHQTPFKTQQSFNYFVLLKTT